MKIGILTFHHVANWGSVLQAYCLQQATKRVSPSAHVEIIDYVPQTSVDFHESQHGGRSRTPLRALVAKPNAYQTKKRACEKFLRDYCSLSNSRLVSDDLEVGARFLANQNYDVVIVGSDTVFQLGPNFGGSYISAPQAPNLYFLPFQAKFKKLAFAASANPVVPDAVRPVDGNALRDLIQDFSFLGIRDDATVNEFTELGVPRDEMQFVPDPTFLFDFGHIGKQPPRVADRRPVAGVAIGSVKLAIEAMVELEANGWKTVNLLSGDARNYGGTNFRARSVEEYIGIFRDFGLLVTDRFHGAIIGLQTSSALVVGVEHSSRYPSANSKVRDLFRRLAIENLIIRVGDEGIGKELSELLSRSSRFNRASLLESFEKHRTEGVLKLCSAIGH